MDVEAAARRHPLAGRAGGMRRGPVCGKRHRAAVPPVPRADRRRTGRRVGRSSEDGRDHAVAHRDGVVVRCLRGASERNAHAAAGRPAIDDRGIERTRGVASDVAVAAEIAGVSALFDDGHPFSTKRSLHLAAALLKVPVPCNVVRAGLIDGRGSRNPKLPSQKRDGKRRDDTPKREMHVTHLFLRGRGGIRDCLFDSRLQASGLADQGSRPEPMSDE